MGNIPLKTYIIIREDLTYSSERLINIVKSVFSIDFNNSLVEDIKEKWLNDGSKNKNYTVFNMNFLLNIEEYLIENGIIFRFIEEGKTTVGLFIEPTSINLRETVLNDCMTLEEYVKSREEFNKLKKENN